MLRCYDSILRVLLSLLLYSVSSIAAAKAGFVTGLQEFSNLESATYRAAKLMCESPDNKRDMDLAYVGGFDPMYESFRQLREYRKDKQRRYTEWHSTPLLREKIYRERSAQYPELYRLDWHTREELANSSKFRSRYILEAKRKVFDSYHKNLLKKKMRERLFQELVTIEHKISPYRAFSQQLPAEQNWTECRALQADNPGFLKTLRQRQNVADANEKSLADSELVSNLWFKDQQFLALTVAAAFEVTFLESMFANNHWHTHGMWPEKSLAFPPIYPEGMGSEVLVSPARRLQKIFSQFPLMRRPSGRLAGLPNATVADQIFSKVFTAAKGPQRRYFFVDQIKPVIERYVEEARKSWDAGEMDPSVLSVGTADGETMELDSEEWLYILAHQRFLRDDLQSLILSWSKKALEKDGPVLRHQLGKILGQAWYDWKLDIQKLRAKACDMDREWLEYLPGLALMVIEESPTEWQDTDSDPLAKFTWNQSALMSGYCHTKWGQTHRRIGESIAEILGVVTGIAGITIPGGQVAFPVSALLFAASYTSRSLRGYDRLMMESALFNPSLAGRQKLHFESAINMALGPISAISVMAYGPKLLPKHLVPPLNIHDKTFWRSLSYFMVGMGTSAYYNYKHMTALGHPALAEPLYYIKLGRSYVGAMMLSHLGKAETIKQLTIGIFYRNVVGFAADHASSSATYLITNEEMNTRNYLWDIQFILTGGEAVKNVYFFGARAIMEHLTGGFISQKGFFPVLSSILFGLFLGDMYDRAVSRQAMRYILAEDDISFFEALLKAELPRNIILDSGEPLDPKSIEELIRIESKSDYMSEFSHFVRDAVWTLNQPESGGGFDPVTGEWLESAPEIAP